MMIIRARIIVTVCTALLFAPVVHLGGQAPQNEPGMFGCERAILPGGAGPNRLRIDVPLLAGTGSSWQLAHEAAPGGGETLVVARRGLSDLRIYDAANREIPYLLIAPPTPEPHWVEGHVLPVTATKQNSGFELDLGRALLADRLRLSGLPAPFLKRARLEASGDRSRWILLAGEGTIFDLPGENLKKLELEFEPGEYRYFRITWDDSASARVPLPGSASVRLGSTQTLPPPLHVPLQFERRTSEPGASRYRLRLPGPRLPIAAIELTSPGANILRRARITESRLTDGRMAPEMLGVATLWHTVAGAPAAAGLRIPISAPQESQLELTIDDGNNPPLEFTAVSAVCAYLPWIYFESPGAEPLTARFGHPDLAPPRYDLEVMRDSVLKLRSAEAHWGDVREKIPALDHPSLDAVPSAGAQLDIAAFQFSRSIPAGKPGLNALLLDAAVLANSNLSDLRIAGADSRQVPYLMEKLEEPLSVDLPAPERIQAPAARPLPGQAESAAASYYHLRLPFSNLPPARLALTTTARVFRRDVYILIERNPADERQEPWTEQIARSAWSHSDPETPAESLILPLPSLQTANTRLVVAEGDNSALPIASARLLLPGYRMRFIRESTADLKLYYGRRDLEAPRYDLALLAPALMGVEAEEVSLSPELPAGSARPETWPGQRIIFWAILAAAVIVLLLLIARLITGRDGEKQN
jgi:hypothetical protein